MLELEKDNLDVAEQTCREALQADPESVLALNALGDIQIAAGKNQAAMDAYLKAAEIDPDEPQTYLNLADLYYEQGKSYNFV